MQVGPNGSGGATNESSSTSELAKGIWSQWVLVSSVTATSGILALAVSFALPKTYTAEATILPRTSNDISGAVAAGLSAQLGPAASMLGGLNSGKTAELVEILSSRTMIDRIIQRCHLDKELEGWQYRSDLVKQVRAMTTIKPPSLKNKVVGIAVDAKDPKLAANVANAYLDELKSMLDEIGYNSASRNRKFVEAQLARAKTDLSEAESKLAEFQSKNQLASLPDSIQTSIRSISELQAKRVSADVELNSLDEILKSVQSKTYSLQTDPKSLTELEIKRNGLIAQRQALEKAHISFVDKLNTLPPKAMKLARLQRDVQVQNAIYLALSQQYETTMISESQDSDAFLPLDRAEAPDRPTGPRKIYVTAMGLLSGLFLSTLVAFLRTKRSLIVS